jgi:hypothetical protein
MRRSVIALASVAGLVLAGVSGYLVVRVTSTPSSAATPSSVSVPTSPTRTHSNPAEPADVIVMRSEIGSEWGQVASVTPDQLGPVPTYPNDKSISGSTSCTGPYKAVQRASGRDVHSTWVNVEIIPKSFQEITVTDIRVRFLSARAPARSPRFLFTCINPNEPSYAATFLSVFADGSQGDIVSASKQGILKHPYTLSDMGSSSFSIDVEAYFKAYEWQVEVDYVDSGKSYTVVRKLDSEGAPLVTEPGQNFWDFDKHFTWCHQGVRGFREGDQC